MPSLFFPDPDILRQVLEREMIPESLACRPGRAFREPNRPGIWIEVASPTQRIIRVLQERNITIGEPPSDATAIRFLCWAELVPLRPCHAWLTRRGTHVFRVPAVEFQAFYRELLRLASHPTTIQATITEEPYAEPSFEVRIMDPPAFSRLRVTDRSASGVIRGYFEQAPRVWVELGYQHPLGHRIIPPEGERLRLEVGKPWLYEPNLPWLEPVEAWHFPRRPTEPAEEVPQTSPLKIKQPLRLVKRGPSDTPELWLIPEHAIPRLTALVRSLDERMIALFRVAATIREGKPCLLLWAKNPRGNLPILLEAGGGYAPSLKLSHFFLPCGYRLSPVLRRDAIRTLFATDPRRLTWLEPRDSGHFAVGSISLQAFRPLNDWLDYRIGDGIRPRSAWNPSATWNLEPFVEAIPSNRPTAVATPSPNVAIPSPDQRSAPTPAVPVDRFWKRAFRWFQGKKEEEVPAPKTEAPTLEESLPVALNPERPRSPRQAERVNALLQRSKRLEEQFLQELPQRKAEPASGLWSDLAGAYTQIDNRTDAAICWLNAIWDQSEPSPSLCWRWLKCEADLAHWNPLQSDFSQIDPSRWNEAKARTLAAYILWATRQNPLPKQFMAQLRPMHMLLDAAEPLLPIRAIWLAKCALTRLSGGDFLGLVRTRDHLIDRLRSEGLRLDVDLPSFLRFAETGVSDRFQTARRWLLDKRKLIRRWITQLRPDSPAVVDTSSALHSLSRFGLEPETRFTAIYADLMLGWGITRLGDGSEAEAFLTMAEQALPTDQPAHQLLLAGFRLRYRHAREGRTPAERWPAAMLQQLRSLSSHDRYCVERLFERSGILDCRTAMRWLNTIQRASALSWGEPSANQLAELAYFPADQRTERIRRLLDSQPALFQQPYQLLCILQFGEVLEIPLVERLLHLATESLNRIAGDFSQQIPLLAETVRQAIAMDRVAFLPALMRQVIRLLEEIPELTKHPDTAGLIGEWIHGLRRAGHMKELTHALEALTPRLTKGMSLAELRRTTRAGWPMLLRMLLHACSGWFALGKNEQATAILEEVRNDLFGTEMSLSDRSLLAIVYAEVVGQLPVRMALGRFEELFFRMDHFATSSTTNTYFTLQPLILIDSIVRAVVQHDFSLRPEVRSWLVDDEYRIRRRIHDDVEAMRIQAGS